MGKDTSETAEKEERKRLLLEGPLLPSAVGRRPDSDSRVVQGGGDAEELEVPAIIEYKRRQ
jgi:hypothetical protein